MGDSGALWGDADGIARVRGEAESARRDGRLGCSTPHRRSDGRLERNVGSRLATNAEIANRTNWPGVARHKPTQGASLPPIAGRLADPRDSRTARRGSPIAAEVILHPAP